MSTGPRRGGNRPPPRWARPVVMNGLADPLIWSLLAGAVALFALLCGLAARGALTGGRPNDRWNGRIDVTVGVIASMRLEGGEWWRARAARYEVAYEYRPVSSGSGEPLRGSQSVEARVFTAIRPGDAIEVFYLASDPRESRILLESGDRREGLVILFGAFLAVSCYVLAANLAARLPWVDRPKGRPSRRSSPR